MIYGAEHGCHLFTPAALPAGQLARNRDAWKGFHRKFERERCVAISDSFYTGFAFQGCALPGPFWTRAIIDVHRTLFDTVALCTRFSIFFRLFLLVEFRWFLFLFPFFFLSFREAVVSTVILLDTMFNHSRWQLIADHNEWPTIVHNNSLLSFWTRRYVTIDGQKLLRSICFAYVFDNT